jgi:CubicO group peptidase (beta-lactamase class C family)
MQTEGEGETVRLLHTEAASPSSFDAESKGESGDLRARLESLNRTLDSLRVASKAEGLSYAMIDENGKYYSHSFGYSDKDRQVLMSDSTVLNFASLSKPVTALAILKLHEESVLNLDQPVNHYLTSWKVTSKEYDPNLVTIRRILNHTSGRSMPSAPFFRLDGRIASVKEVLNGDNKEKKPLRVKYRPGDAWHYSAGGYTTLELLMEDVLREEFNSSMNRLIFRKLDMKDSSFDSRALLRSKTKIYDKDGKPIAPYHTVGSAAGGLYTTIKDFARFVVELRAAYNDKGLIIRKKTMKQILQSRAAVDLSDFGLSVKGVECGLGFFVRVSDSDTLLYHSGANPGVGAYFVVSLVTGKALIIAANSDNVGRIVERLMKEWGKLNDVVVPDLF